MSLDKKKLEKLKKLYLDWNVIRHIYLLSNEMPFELF
jgi:hypothetical protein